LAERFDFLVVGAGFAGSVAAERLASFGHRVLVVDRRGHIGGNAHDVHDAAGLLVHTYGPHIFHTNAKRIFDYLSRFTKWRAYEHRVLAKVGDQLLPIPINQTTINRLYGLELDETGVREYLDKVRVPRSPIATSEDVVLSSVGEDLCDKFFRGYTRKQWGLDLSELSAGVAARIPTRTDRDDRYFNDTYQAMPAQGYTEMFRNILDHENIRVRLECDFFLERDKIVASHTIYTGPIDAYFNYCHGRLPYRSLRFEHEHLPDVDRYQAVGTVNFPNDFAYTRITEFKHLSGQSHSGTSIVREYPKAEGEPYYPIPRSENQALYKKYQEMAERESNTSFVGRLAQYRYYNMDQVVAAALHTIDSLLGAGH
jgi:UDP-galactopyranose mutase